MPPGCASRRVWCARRAAGVTTRIARRRRRRSGGRRTASHCPSREQHPGSMMSPREALRMPYHFGSCVLDEKLHVLHRDGKRVELRRQAFDLLVYLVENHARLVTKLECLDRICEGRAVVENT